MKKWVRRPRVDVPLSSVNAHGHAMKTLIVLHQTISPDVKGIGDVKGVGHYLDTKGYDIHVITDVEGLSGAVKPEDETAIFWHCQGANTESIGIEQVSYKTGDPKYWWRRAKQLHKTARWCAYLCKKHGIPPVYDPYAKRGICGHYDVTQARGIPGGHTDCQYPNYPTKWVANAAKTYMKLGWT
jgi:hypothetical protein